jgi:hypothetical protein
VPKIGGGPENGGTQPTIIGGVANQKWKYNVNMTNIDQQYGDMVENCVLSINGDLLVPSKMWF